MAVLEAARAERFYAEGAELLDWLAPPGRRMFGLLMATVPRSAPTRSLCARRMSSAGAFRTGRLKKLRLLARWSLLPPRKGDLQ